MENEEKNNYNKITDQHIKEGIGRSYIDALISYAGFNTCKDGFDYGFDGGFIEVKKRDDRIVSSGFRVDYQLKSSSNITINNNLVEYDLEAKNYNDLVDPDVGTPRILFLYHMPKDFKEYITVTQNSTVFKYCAWWYSLKDQPPTTNSHTKRIKIPVENIVTKDSLKNIMKLAKGGKL